jgi:sugar lactone lactonase YvrE
MKIVKSIRERRENIFVEDGELKYAIEPFWAKWPDAVRGFGVLGVAVDKDDNLYATTTHWENPICIFDRNGNFIRSIGKGLFIRPHAICFTKNNTLIIPDTSDWLHVAREIDMNGKLIRDFGTLGVPSDSGYDRKALAHARKSGKIPADIEWTPWVDFHLREESIKRTAEPFNMPTATAISAKTGEIFFSDGYGNAAVHKFDAQGKYVETWGKGYGTEIGQYRLPHWVWFDKYDRLWLCDRENCRAYVYSTTGEILALVQGGFMGIGSVWTDDRYIYFTERQGGISILNIDTFETAAQFGYDGFGILDCHAVYGDSRGNLYIATTERSPQIGNLYRFRKC